MARASSTDVFRTFRFALFLPNYGRVVGCSMVYSDPFTGNLWIERAHQGHEPSLREHLRGEKTVEVWLFQHLAAGGLARRISVTWDDLRWLPFDLDATASSVALERLVLVSPYYEGPVDVAADDLPYALHAIVSPKAGVNR